ncbi:MAG: OmpA family protein [Chitinophagaceae bacterium]|nr:OmpA family protein [Chitinophagaceae bacterium]
MKPSRSFIYTSIGLLFAICLSMPAQSQLLKKLKDKANSVVDKTVGTGSSAAKEASAEVKTLKDTVLPKVSIEAYQNYDFVPGDKIVFEDNFVEDEEGEFPIHWNLISGQATLNKIVERKALLLSTGWTRVSPAIKIPTYLTDTFTIEFDNYCQSGYGPELFFFNSDDDSKGNDMEIAKIMFCEGNNWTGIFAKAKTQFNGFSAQYPVAIQGVNYYNKWHHIAITYKNKRLKVYVDQYRVLSMPDFGVSPKSIAFKADGIPNGPIIIANLRIANGGGMKMQEKKFMDTKIVTHGINFDIDKATIKPESMGTLNMIVEVLKNNPDIKFDIQGHTDNTGNAAHNLTLSQQRADAVKDALVGLGVDAARLTTIGKGDASPIADNATPEGKANNRRVEFVTIKD